MDMAGTIGGFRKLNTSNYMYWRACIEAYLQGQDLWEVVGGSETMPPEVAIEEATESEKSDDPKSGEKKSSPAEKAEAMMR